MRIAVVNSQVPFVNGGAELLASTLNEELRRRKIDSCLVTIPFKWYPNETLIKNVQACWNIDLTESSSNKIDKVICLKYPIYCISHPEKIIWLCHQHRPVYDMWNRDVGGCANTPENRKLRSFIKFSDNEAFQKAKRVYSISNNVAKRLYRYNNFESEVLYPPLKLELNDFQHTEYDKIILCPSRINRLKRQHIIAEAFCRVKSSFKLIFTGIIEDQMYFDEINQIVRKYNRESDVKFLGFIPTNELSRLYKSCGFVIFIPYDEDYGYITVESMANKKAVICSNDSGGVNEFIEHEKNGYVVSPVVLELSDAIMKMVSNNNFKKLGTAAFDKFKSLNITWDKAIEKLIN